MPVFSPPSRSKIYPSRARKTVDRLGASQLTDGLPLYVQSDLVVDFIFNFFLS
jgi:hypothetical protein